MDFDPNVGYLGDAYGNFGLLGMLLFSAILGVALRIVDSVGSPLPSYFVAAAISMPAIALTQSALFTSMSTHGLIPAMLMLWVFRALVRNSGGMNALCVPRSNGSKPKGDEAEMPPEKQQ